MLSREQLLSRVWAYDFDPGSDVVDVHVGFLRKKLGAEPASTVRGTGYCVGWGSPARAVARQAGVPLRAVARAASG